MAKSTLASIPSYVKPTVKLPNNVCSKIDRICQNFIRGSSESNRKVHLISWNKICSPKEDGGLGFRKEKEVNLACMMKLAWGIINKPESLWVKVMRYKYGCVDGILPKVR